MGELPQDPRNARVGGMLEMTGGRFDNLEHGVALSGDVCALVGLKTVVTGDTIMIAPDKKTRGASAAAEGPSFCAGVASPKPGLTVRLEAESMTDQQKMVDALTLFCIEDPSLIMEDMDSTTLLS